MSKFVESKKYDFTKVLFRLLIIFYLIDLSFVILVICLLLKSDIYALRYVLLKFLRYLAYIAVSSLCVKYV
jgi:hypothetical protein